MKREIDRYLAILLIFIFLCLFSSISIAQERSQGSVQLTEQQARDELEAVFAERMTAVKHKDKEKSKSYYSSDYSVKLPNGQILTRQEVVDLLIVNEDLTSQIIDSTIEIEKLKVKGNEVIVDMKQSQTYKQTLKDGTTGNLVRKYQLRETWIKTPDGWKHRFTDNLSVKTQEVTFNGKKLKRSDQLQVTSPQMQIPNSEDKPLLDGGKSLVFIYWIEGGSGGTFPVFCDDIEIARLKRKYFFKIKLEPGLHTFRSDTGDPVSINLEPGRIYYLKMKESFQFPKMRGTIIIDEGPVGPQSYRLPGTLEIKPLEATYIKDHSRVITSK